MARICLICPHHVSFQPRTLREADSLHEAGHEVRVVCRQLDPILSERDTKLMQSRKWRLQALDLQRQGANWRAWFAESARSHFYEKIFDAGLKTVPVAVRSYVRGREQLTRLAAEEPADWFIAHTQAALPIAAVAAELWQAKLGCDFEDMLAYIDTDLADVIRLIEKNYLPLCQYVSVPSQCIASYLRRDFALDNLLTLYNSFPLSLANGMLDPTKRPERATMRLHWFGQTIGPGRGIEDAIEAVGIMGKKEVELHLRGRITDSYRLIISALVRKHRANVVLQPAIDHDHVISAMEQFDVGLALERPDHGNYSRTVTNKVFSYLLAGLAIAATDTPGQREILEQSASAGFLYPAEKPQVLASRLLEWHENRRELRNAQKAAWDAARRRFCWDHEKEKLLTALEISSHIQPRQAAYFEAR